MEGSPCKYVTPTWLHLLLGRSRRLVSPRKKTDKFEYNDYVLMYVDDLLVISHQGEKTIKALEEYYRLKDGFHLPRDTWVLKLNNGNFPKTSPKLNGHYRRHNISKRL
jgi:hypothetical protein